VSGSNFQLSERRIDERTIEIRIAGELDLAVADRLHGALAAASAERVLIDLEPCEFIDSSGIAVILRANQLAGKRGARVLVHGAGKQVRRIFLVTGLERTGIVFADRAEALAAAAPEDGPVTQPS
jgi:anti-anti-sigma factor